MVYHQNLTRVPMGAFPNSEVSHWHVVGLRQRFGVNRLRGTESSNPCSSSGESGANLIFGGEFRRWRSEISAFDDPSQPCAIGYFAKIPSARLKALSIACSGRHPVGHDVEHGDAEDMLGTDLGHGRVERLVKRKRRTDQRLLGVSRAMRVLME